MTKADILEHYKNINFMYNRPYEYETLSHMIDEMIEDWLDSFNTDSATKCFEAVNILKERLKDETGN